MLNVCAIVPPDELEAPLIFVFPDGVQSKLTADAGVVVVEIAILGEVPEQIILFEADAFGLGWTVII